MIHKNTSYYEYITKKIKKSIIVPAKWYNHINSKQKRKGDKMGNYLDISYPGIDIEQRTEYSKMKIDSIYGMEYISLLNKDINMQKSKEFNDIYKKEGKK